MVSILMPFKDAELWITETIDSILSQEYSDWELICVDDYSEDTGSSIVEEYAHNDHRIQVHSNEMQGIIPALQKAFFLAKGEYLTRMDADDLMPYDRLSLMVDRIKRCPSRSIVTGKVQYFTESKISDGYLKYQDWLNERIDKKDHWQHIYRECVVASPNWLGTLEEFKLDRIFDELSYPEDYNMCFQWLATGYNIEPIGNCTLHWREHPARTSRISEMYDQKSFFEMKLRWFVLNHPHDSISILGAKRKGKLCASILSNLEKGFAWYDKDYERFGAGIDDHTILNSNELKGDQLLVTVYPDDRINLEEFLISKEFEIGRNAWYV